MATGSISPATSSLASELLLNKIMNGELKTNTGKTVTAAGRAVSAALSGDAYESRAAEQNMAYGQGVVTAAQNEVSNIKDKLLKMKADLLAVANNDGATTTLITSIGKQAGTVAAEINASATAAEYNGKKLLTGAGVVLNAGNGMTIKVANATVSTNKALVSVTTKLKAVKSKATAEAAVTAINAAIDSMVAFESGYSDSVKNLQNRALLLADQGASLDAAASAQSIAGMSGASDLLSSMLGGNTTA